MKVLIVIPYLASVYGGPSKVVRELAWELASLGLSVDVITTDANGLEKLDVPINQWVEERNYRIQYFSCWHRNDLIISSSLIYWLFRHASQYDIVHTHNRFAPLILTAEWICRHHKVPYVITPHGMLEPWALSYKARKKRLYYDLMEKPSIQDARAIHVLNETEACNIQKLGFSQTAVIPNGIHRSEFDSLPDPEVFFQEFPRTRDKVLILFLGRIDPKKGLDLLATAFGQAYQKFSHAHLIVAGPDSIGFLSTARDYFSEAGCLEAVTFTGMLTGEVKRSALAAASLYVAPSYSEGFSMSVLEGMASGLCCILTKGCNFPEVADAQVARVVDIDADAIANALMQSLSDLQQAKAMGDRAREFIFQNYTWEHAARKLGKVYQDIVLQQRATKANDQFALAASKQDR